MLEYLDSLNLEELPSERHFELVIGCWARNSLLRYNAADVLQQLFSRFEEKHSDKTWKLSATVYQRIISIWCRDGRVEDAEGLLRHFMVLWKENCFHVQSSGLVTKMFNFLLSAYFRQDNPEKVLTVWHEMNHHQVPHDAATYAIVLKALSRLNDRDAGHLAYKIWRDLRSDDKIIEVSAVHYGALISALARSPSRQSAEAAVDALEMLERRYQESNFENHRLKPQQAHYSSTITALSRSNDPKAEEKAYDIFNRMKKSMKPDTIAYSALISALSFGRSEESAEKAEAILEEMEALSDSSDENGVRPNAITYCSCINAWGRSGSRDAPFRAEAILKRLEQRYMASGDITLKPDKMIYVALLHAWSKSRRPEAGKLAEAILRQLESLEKETGESLVDAVIYTNVIVSHWKSNAKNSYLKAESLLQEMKKRVAAGDIKCSPDTFVYTTVIQAYARSVLPNKAEKAWELLEEMCKEYKRGNMALRPNVVSFTACLNACAFTRGDYACRERALKVVLATMAEFRSHTYDTGTPIMYGTLIKAFSNLVQDPEERLRYSGIAFQRCCEEGLVNSVIINVLKDKAPELYNRLPRNRNGEIELHPEWSMNVEEQPYRFPTNHSS
jgi:pentatricopeptide repeat protein